MVSIEAAGGQVFGEPAVSSCAHTHPTLAFGSWNPAGLLVPNRRSRPDTPGFWLRLPRSHSTLSFRMIVLGIALASDYRWLNGEITTADGPPALG
ncbi:hypothetical protein Cob_v011731 [Colletotrichum orbiculare MAFF 240422]|uniref:Uncharacterized protein n=1 Tax=Colletotrichum orbiculare (strain 104-T / ATCC 96160 / CBS 514.97 / LARS 414 / MAFF 240422) TaxID=1213857 RepID=A0A484FCP7_COLOR|nr:hypothetical protein Cob_v011731 [Colletotrichum orbiculare MAFF 240422]